MGIVGPDLGVGDDLFYKRIDCCGGVSKVGAVEGIVYECCSVEVVGVIGVWRFKCEWSCSVFVCSDDGA